MWIARNRTEKQSQEGLKAYRVDEARHELVFEHGFAEVAAARSWVSVKHDKKEGSRGCKKKRRKKKRQHRSREMNT